MKIYFVLGLPHSGKSVFIRETWPNIKRFDILDYQNSRKLHEGHKKRIALEQMAYDAAGIIKSRHYDTMVIEFPGLLIAERKVVRRIISNFMANNDTLNVYWIFTDDVWIKKRLENENFNPDDLVFLKQAVEFPDVNEGYDNVFSIETYGATSSEEQILEQAQIHLGYVGHDVSEASNLLSNWARGLIDTTGE